MGTILASQSQADSATTTTPAYGFNADDVVTATVTNGAPPPNQFCQVALQVSADGINWKAAETKWAGGQANFTYICKYELADYVALAQQYGLAAWAQFRLVFSGNVGAAVTIAATDADPGELAVVPLTATSATTGGAVGVWTPPGGQAVIVTRVIIYVITASTGAANVNAGQGSSATTSYTNLIPATSVHTSGSTIDSVTTQIQAATAAESGLLNLAVLVPAGNVVTFTGSATTVGMVATAYIFYLEP